MVRGGSKGQRRPSLADVGRRKITSVDEYRDYWDEVISPNDRVTAIVACAQLEGLLADLMKTRFIALTEAQTKNLFAAKGGVLASLSSRIRNCVRTWSDHSNAKGQSRSHSTNPECVCALRSERTLR